LTEGKNVDIVCDAHNLTGSFERESFEVVVSHTVFEHLLFPWKVILEINQILRKGGFLWIWTHPAWPQHELPFDYWRYQENSFHGLLNEFTGFEILELEESFPAKLEVAPPFTFTVLDDIGRHPINLGIGVLAKKISDPIETLAWDLLPDDLNAIRKQKK
jgi:SAM-dependent methyltransferase